MVGTSGGPEPLFPLPLLFCFEELFLGCFEMKISLPGIAFPASGVWQEEGAAASQPRSPRQSPSRATRGPVGPERRPAGPQGVKQTEKKKKVQKEGKQKKTNFKKIQLRTTNQSRNSYR